MDEFDTDKAFLVDFTLGKIEEIDVIKGVGIGENCDAIAKNGMH